MIRSGPIHLIMPVLDPRPSAPPPSIAALAGLHDDRADPPPVGRRRGGGPRLGRRLRRRPPPACRPTTITSGLRELRGRARRARSAPIRRAGFAAPGGGRKPLTRTDPALLSRPSSAGRAGAARRPAVAAALDLQEHRKLAEELHRQGHPVSDRTVAALLHEAGYSLQANRKTREGARASRPQRPVRVHQRAGAAVPEARAAGGVGGHEEEGIGRGFQERRPGVAAPRASREEVRVHDFLDKALGKAIPYGVYDLTHNQGWVSVGIDHDTARVRRRDASAAGGRRWAASASRGATELLITADGGGSNS